jgi:16S rRNA (guanine527-N7)-methyltransferase
VSADPVLAGVLSRARALGVLGPGPVEDHVSHALAYGAALPAAPARVLDLGSGAGVPGLVLARQVWTGSAFVLLEAGERRAALLREAVAELGLGERVAVHRGRAEEAGRDPALRGTFDAVVARSFAAPAVTAECAAPFLRVGGHLVVSDPPEEDPARWPAEGLAELGLSDDGAGPGPVHLRRLRQVTTCPDRYPRRAGIPAKRPCW